jgi:HK97 family phage major capsid protein
LALGTLWVMRGCFPYGSSLIHCIHLILRRRARLPFPSGAGRAGGATLSKDIPLFNEDQLRRRRAEAKAGQKTIIDTAKADRRRNLSASETAVFRSLTESIEDIDSQLADAERRTELHDGADRIFNAASQGRAGGPTRGHDAYSDGRNSFVRDLIGSVTPAVDTSGEGRQRLDGFETRNVTGLTSSTAFDPPQYLLDLYARVSRPNAPLYSLLGKVKLDAPVVKTPKISSGNTAYEQSAENATINTTEWVDEYITVTPNTYAAASYVSDQALSLSPVELDGLIFSDLFASLAVSIENAVLYDAAFGLDTLATSTGTVFATGSSDTADGVGVIRSRAERDCNYPIQHKRCCRDHASECDSASNQPCGYDWAADLPRGPQLQPRRYSGSCGFAGAECCAGGDDSGRSCLRRCEHHNQRRYGSDLFHQARRLVRQRAWSGVAGVAPHRRPADRVAATHAFDPGCYSPLSGGVGEGHRVRRCDDRVRRQLMPWQGTNVVDPYHGNGNPWFEDLGLLGAELIDDDQITESSLARWSRSAHRMLRGVLPA